MTSRLHGQLRQGTREGIHLIVVSGPWEVGRFVQEIIQPRGTLRKQHVPKLHLHVTALALETLLVSSLTGMIGRRVSFFSDWTRLCPLAASSLR